MMHYHRQSSERSDQAARSPCPALRAAAAEHGQLPGLFSANRNPHHYDPFHGNNWRPDASSYHNPHNPSGHQGWRHHPVPPQNRPMPVASYPYPDPFHMAAASGYPHQDQGGPQLIPMMNAPENQGTPSSLPPFSYRPTLPSMSSTPHIHHARNGSQGSDATRPGSLPALNPNPNPILPTTSVQPSRASLFGDASSLSPHDYMGMSHHLSPLQAGPYTPQGTSTSSLRHRAELNNRPGSIGEGGNSQSASNSPTRAQTAASQGRNDRSPTRDASSEERRGPSVRYRRATPTVPRSMASSTPSSESSSDEDAEAGERSPSGYGFLEFLGSGMPEDRVRAQQLLRGTMTAKRVASKTAIASLQSIKISDLPQSDRVCVICYNDYGVQNPEGINEAPLRLPKCKHVFGDHCIKKWFEENDTCPYCRDKVPSEPQGGRFSQNRTPHHMLQFLHQQHAHMQMMRRYQQNQSRESNLSGSSDNHSRFGRSLNHHGALVDLYTPGGRLPAWPAYPLERRSPGNDADNARRRPRARHGPQRTSPSARSFGGSTTNGSSQNPYYLGANTQLPNHNGRHPTTLPGPSSGSGFEMHLPSPSFYSHVGTQHDPYHNPLTSVNHAATGENFRGSAPHHRADHIPPLSPTIGGPEVDMTNAEQTTPRRAGSHQHS